MRSFMTVLISLIIGMAIGVLIGDARADGLKLEPLKPPALPAPQSELSIDLDTLSPATTIVIEPRRGETLLWKLNENITLIKKGPEAITCVKIGKEMVRCQ